MAYLCGLCKNDFHNHNTKSDRCAGDANSNALKAAIIKRYPRSANSKPAVTPPKEPAQAEDEKKTPVRVV